MAITPHPIPPDRRADSFGFAFPPGRRRSSKRRYLVRAVIDDAERLQMVREAHGRRGVIPQDIIANLAFGQQAINEFSQRQIRSRLAEPFRQIRHDHTHAPIAHAGVQMGDRAGAENGLFNKKDLPRARIGSSSFDSKSTSLNPGLTPARRPKSGLQVLCQAMGTALSRCDGHNWRLFGGSPPIIWPEKEGKIFPLQ
jgi:hypothetical protein